MDRMTTRILYDADTDPSALVGHRVAVMGYGSQGHAHALNLRDSGIELVVGLRPGSSRRATAGEAGLTVMTPAEAAAWADVVMILVPDQHQAELFTDDIAPHLETGDTVLFAHGFNVHFGRITPPPGVDIAMVAPKGPGHLVRRTYTEGSGVPCLVAVAADPSGEARELALAYAAAIGGGRAGILETTFAEETETDLFGEQVILCGGVSALIKAAFETLTEAGYAPESAYFEVLHELKLIVDLLYEGGLGWMRHSISDTAEYGDFTRGPRIITDDTRAAMREILAEIRSGAFADEWMSEHAAGQPRLKAYRQADASHPVETVGAGLREMMPFLTPRHPEDDS